MQKIGCAQIGEVLNLTGIMTTANWVQLTDRRGWVDASSVQLSPQTPQAFEANKETPRVTSVGAGAKVHLAKSVSNDSPARTDHRKEIGIREGTCRVSLDLGPFCSDCSSSYHGGSKETKSYLLSRV